MLAVLLVVGLVVGAGIGYFMAPSETDEQAYNRGYDEGYDDGSASSAPVWGSDPPDDFTDSQSATKNEVQGLYTLLYGAIAASLIAALASIVSLMQISNALTRLQR
jgi:hypothetical protein